MKIVQKKNRNLDFIDEVFDNVFRTPFFAFSDKIIKMQTDLREKEENYILDIDLAGFDKENIDISIDDGYMTVKANVSETNEEAEKEYIRQERHIESCSRSYYVGDISESDIKANFNNGILTIVFPKGQERTNAKKHIPID